MNSWITPSPLLSENQVIVHHLSDLHFRVDGPEQGILSDYGRYLEELPKGERPQVVIISGDLTATGSQAELSNVASQLRGIFSVWGNELAQHVFVVAGPQDINWEKKPKDDNPSLDPFSLAFKDFGLSETQTAMPVDSNYLVYPIPTCYLPDVIPADAAQQLEKASQTYRQFRRDFNRRYANPVYRRLLNDEKRCKMAEDLRQRFMQAGETVLTFDAGCVAKQDVDALQTRLAALPQPTPGQKNPLKILLTHHPLLVPEATYSLDKSSGEQFKKLLAVARSAGVELALHGHLHKPQVLSDISITNAAPQASQLRQIGAGSLGLSRTFNKIIAMRSTDTNSWRLRVETIIVPAKAGTSPVSLVILDSSGESDAERLAQKTAALLLRQRFEKQLGQLLQQFAELVKNKAADQNLTSIFLTLQNLISGIFPGIPLRIGLTLKEVRGSGYELVDRYLISSQTELPNLGYPLTTAAWALLLGRPIRYRDDFTGNNTLTMIGWMGWGS